MARYRHVRRGDDDKKKKPFEDAAKAVHKDTWGDGRIGQPIYKGMRDTAREKEQIRRDMERRAYEGEDTEDAVRHAANDYRGSVRSRLADGGDARGMNLRKTYSEDEVKDAWRRGLIEGASRNGGGVAGVGAGAGEGGGGAFPRGRRYASFGDFTADADGRSDEELLMAKSNLEKKIAEMGGISGAPSQTRLKTLGDSLNAHNEVVRRMLSEMGLQEENAVAKLQGIIDDPNTDEWAKRGAAMSLRDLNAESGTIKHLQEQLEAENAKGRPTEGGETPQTRETKMLDYVNNLLGERKKAKDAADAEAERKAEYETLRNTKLKIDLGKDQLALDEQKRTADYENALREDAKFRIAKLSMAISGLDLNNREDLQSFNSLVGQIRNVAKEANINDADEFNFVSFDENGRALLQAYPLNEDGTINKEGLAKIVPIDAELMGLAAKDAKATWIPSLGRYVNDSVIDNKLLSTGGEAGVKDSDTPKPLWAEEGFKNVGEYRKSIREDIKDLEERIDMKGLDEKSSPEALELKRLRKLLSDSYPNSGGAVGGVASSWVQALDGDEGGGAGARGAEGVKKWLVGK